MVFITAGKGGGTGTGAAPVIADVAKNLGILTIGIVTRPFAFEGKRRSDAGRQGIQKLKEKVDTLIIIPNDRLFTLDGPERRRWWTHSRWPTRCCLQGVQGITDLINIPGLINTDFADVKMVMNNAGSAIMGIGTATGEGRAANAAATRSPRPCSRPRSRARAACC